METLGTNHCRSERLRQRDPHFCCGRDGDDLPRKSKFSAILLCGSSVPNLKPVFCFNGRSAGWPEAFGRVTTSCAPASMNGARNEIEANGELFPALGMSMTQR